MARFAPKGLTYTIRSDCGAGRAVSTHGTLTEAKRNVDRVSGNPAPRWRPSAWDSEGEPTEWRCAECDDWITVARDGGSP